MLVNYDLLDRIGYRSTIKYNGYLKVSESPVLFLKDILYREEYLLEGSILHLLIVN